MKMKLQDYRKLSNEQLVKIKAELEKSQKNISKRKFNRDIARINTLLRERELEGE